jgi:hypothetical protein
LMKPNSDRHTLSLCNHPVINRGKNEGKDKMPVWKILTVCAVFITLSGCVVQPHGHSGIVKHQNAVCHKGKTIYVSESAVRAHLRHGDSLGPCY